MKVEVDGKMYCVETLIYDNERLRKDVIAGAELHRLILDSLRADIEKIVECEMNVDEKWALGLKYSLQIIDNYRNNKITKGCHTCIWNDEPPLKFCEILQKESKLLHCPNWEKAKTDRGDEVSEEMLDIMKASVAQIILHKKMQKRSEE